MSWSRRSCYSGQMSAVRVVGLLIAVAGLVLAAVPTLVSDPGPAADTYAAIERRVWYGAIAGFGALLVARTSLEPWVETVAAFVFWIVAGFLAARVIGLALDGIDSGKQWLWTAIEVAICVVAWLFLRHRRLKASQAPEG